MKYKFAWTRTLAVAALILPATAIAAGLKPYAGISLANSEGDLLDSTSTFKVFGGGRAENLAIELAYVDLGDVTVTGPGGTASIDASGLEASVAGFWPVGGNFELFAKGGLFAWSVDVSATLVGFGFIAGTDSGTDLTFGVGGQFRVSDTVAVRVEYQQFNDVSGIDYDYLSAGISASF